MRKATAALVPTATLLVSVWSSLASPIDRDVVVEPAGAPAVTGDRVVVASAAYEGGLYALNRSTGELAWRGYNRSSEGLHLRAIKTTGAGPWVWDGTIVAYAQSELGVIDPEDGMLIKNTTLEARGVRKLVQGGDQFIRLDSEGGLSAVSLDTFALSWSFTAPADWSVTRWAPITPTLTTDADRDQLVASMGHSLVEWNLSTGRMRWNYTFGVIDEIEHAVTVGHVVGVNGVQEEIKSRAFRAGTGEPVWNGSLDLTLARSRRGGGPVATGLDGAVHILERDGHLFSLDARDGRVRSSVDLGMTSLTGSVHPACSGDEPFCPSSGIVLVFERKRYGPPGALYAIEPGNGVLWETSPRNGLEVSVEGRTAFLASPGRVQAVDVVDGTVRWTADLVFERDSVPPRPMGYPAAMLAAAAALTTAAILWGRRAAGG